VIPEEPHCIGKNTVPSKHVLVVDDDAAIRGLVRAILQRDRQYEIDEASDGHEAVERLSANTYDALVLDLMLPRATAFDVLDFLARENITIRCVIVSAASQKILDGLDNSNIIAKLRKPFDINDLVTAIRSCFDDASLRKP
jgi:DNA-binding response OmpR family regulator